MTFSAHALRRRQQRAIGLDAIEACLAWGALIRQRCGRLAFHLGRREVKAARHAGADVRRHQGVAVILSADECVVTVVRSSDRRRLKRWGRRCS